MSRVTKLSQFTGQPDVERLIGFHVEACRKSGSVFPHGLFFGPPGLGKTTLAGVIAGELGVRLHYCHGASLREQEDIIGILRPVKAGDILFIDEVHAMPRSMLERLYTVLEDRVIDLVIGSNGYAVSRRVKLPEFTVLSATTSSGLVPKPFRDRCPVSVFFDFYSEDGLANAIRHMPGSDMFDDEAVRKIASVSRGTPRVAKSILDTALKSMTAFGKSPMDAVLEAMSVMGIRPDGLNRQDMKYLKTLCNIFSGGPAGLTSIATAIGEDKETVEYVIEPYLVRIGYVVRTSRGRILGSNFKGELQ
ncbi:MAG: Holliday junction ATP-dependent DNA helicase RuvB [Phycisphaerae bacterium]|nr:MAG: Holliday junction ATP-dependent DNA helicase RuvB [Phycisphaerae bacterium]